MSKIKEKNLERDIELNKLIRLIRTLDTVNKLALKAYYDIIYKTNTTFKSVYKDGITTIELPSSDLFKKAYGALTVSFEGRDIRQINLIDVQPKKYLESCYMSMPISYKGLFIPDTAKDRFKVDLALRLK